MRDNKKRTSGTAARLIREARLAAGLSQTQLARAARTSQSVVSAYEAGSREPSVPMLERMVSASGNTLVIRFEPDSDRYPISELAADIARARGKDRRLRLVFEFVRAADDDGHDIKSLVTNTPRATGDPRFDAMIAAVAEHICVRSGVRVPMWVLDSSRFLDQAWWVSDLPSARIQALVHTPASFRRRGVMIDRHDLHSA